METLPETIVAQIFSYISQLEAFRASLASRYLWECFNLPQTFSDLVFSCEEPAKFACQYVWLEKYKDSVKSLRLVINQGVVANRQNACRILSFAATLDKLSRLFVNFVGQNPLFYAGADLAPSLQDIFIQGKPNRLSTVDLSKMDILFQNPLADAIFSTNFDSLQMLDLQNGQLVCNVTADVLEHCVMFCKNLVDLRTFHACMSDRILMAFAEPNRAKLKHVSILCRRSDKWEAVDLTESAWSHLLAANSDFSVTLKFDHTCWLEYLRRVMIPFLPVATLHLETYTKITSELVLATQRYARTLRKIVLQTQPSDELDICLIQMAQSCENLVSVHVMCVVKPETIETVLQARPAMARLGRYTLKSEMEHHPWVTDHILDEIYSR